MSNNLSRYHDMDPIEWIRSLPVNHVPLSNIWGEMNK